MTLNGRRNPERKWDDTSGVVAPEFVWQAKASFEVRYYQTEKALVDYFGTDKPMGYVITKFKKEAELSR